MVFNPTLYFILAVIIALVCAFVLGRYLNKFMHWYKAGETDRAATVSVLFAIVACITLIYFFNSNANDLVVIFEDDEHDEYIFIGHTTFESNGVTYDIERQGEDDCFIINSSETLLVMERVVYGESLFNFEPDRIAGLAPGSIMAKSDLPDYYPWQRPPNSVSVSETRIIGWDTRRWLRYGSRDEAEKFARQSEEDEAEDY